MVYFINKKSHGARINLSTRGMENQYLYRLFENLPPTNQNIPKTSLKPKYGAFARTRKSVFIDLIENISLKSTLIVKISTLWNFRYIWRIPIKLQHQASIESKYGTFYLKQKVKEHGLVSIVQLSWRVASPFQEFQWINYLTQHVQYSFLSSVVPRHTTIPAEHFWGSMTAETWKNSVFVMAPEPWTELLNLL